jgi:hypothetical protein
MSNWAAIDVDELSSLRYTGPYLRVATSSAGYETRELGMEEKEIALLEFGQGWSMWLTSRHLPLTIGRSLENAIILPENLAVSRRHCKLEVRDGLLHVVDFGSTNGTVVNDRLLKGESARVAGRTCILLADTLLWITPCDPSGKLAPEALTRIVEAPHIPADDLHGVCLVDICDSSELEPQIVERMMKYIREAIIAVHAERILLLKHLGDGLLAVLDSPRAALESAERLMEWQASTGRETSVDLRITLEAGPTYPASGHDRLGMAITRAFRFEKTQWPNIEKPGKYIDKLNPRNRILLGTSMRRELAPALQRRCVFVGRRRLRGFGKTLYSIYQYRHRPTSPS